MLLYPKVNNSEMRRIMILLVMCMLSQDPRLYIDTVIDSLPKKTMIISQKRILLNFVFQLMSKLNTIF